MVSVFYGGADACRRNIGTSFLVAYFVGNPGVTEWGTCEELRVHRVTVQVPSVATAALQSGCSSLWTFEKASESQDVRRPPVDRRRVMIYDDDREGRVLHNLSKQLSREMSTEPPALTYHLLIISPCSFAKQYYPCVLSKSSGSLVIR